MSLATEVGRLEHRYYQSIELLNEILKTLNVDKNRITSDTKEGKENFQMWIDRWEKRVEQIVS